MWNLFRSSLTLLNPSLALFAADSVFSRIRSARAAVPPCVPDMSAVLAGNWRCPAGDPILPLVLLCRDHPDWDEPVDVLCPLTPSRGGETCPPFRTLPPEETT